MKKPAQIKRKLTSAKNSVGADILSSASVYSDKLKSSFEMDDVRVLFVPTAKLPFDSSIVIVCNNWLLSLLFFTIQFNILVTKSSMTFPINFHFKINVKNITKENAFLCIFIYFSYAVENNKK